MLLVGGGRGTYETILQVEITVVIYEISGCIEVFWQFCRFDPPPTKLLFDPPHLNFKVEKFNGWKEIWSGED